LLSRLGGAQSTSAWDLTALLNAADARAPRPERHLWLARLLEWLRHDPPRRSAEATTPAPLLRLRHLLNVLEQHPPHRAAVQALVQRFWSEIDAAALFAEFGFPQRVHLAGELIRRLRERVLPSTPDTTDLAELFPLLFDSDDAEWIAAIDEPTLQRLAALLAPSGEGEAGPGAPAEHAHDPAEVTQERLFTGISIVVGLLGIGLGWMLFSKRPLMKMPRLLEEKYKVDEFYDAVLINPIKAGSREGLWRFFDVGVIDGLVNGLGRGTAALGGLLRYLQAGFVRSYAAIILVGALAVLGYFAWNAWQLGQLAR
jgi:hypothetical protein